jgi:hypothetical protein
MDTARFDQDAGEQGGTPTPPAPGEGLDEQAPAWEQVGNGRYMPRRIRGSCHGRELG